MFRILSIDGGGVRGMFPAAFLARLEQVTAKRMVDHFDLIAGTSTGGIIAIGLGLGLTAADLVNLYEKRAKEIFPERRGWLGQVYRFVRPAYSPAPLEGVLREILGERLLGEAQCRLVIPAFDVTSGTVRIYKTAHHPRLRVDYLEKAWTVARATSAAPTYFPSYASEWGTALVDGGVWANNPAMVALVEAMAILDVPREDIHMLSLGTTEEPLSVTRATLTTGGQLRWILPALNLMMYGQSEAATNQAQHLLGSERFLRITDRVAPGRFALDKVNGVADLKVLGAESALRNLERVDLMFLQTPVETFQPSHVVPT